MNQSEFMAMRPGSITSLRNPLAAETAGRIERPRARCATTVRRPRRWSYSCWRPIGLTALLVDVGIEAPSPVAQAHRGIRQRIAQQFYRGNVRLPDGQAVSA